jgi:hypothetical protein
MVGRRIAEGKLADGFTARDVYKKGWSGISSHSEAEGALRILEDFDWVRGYEAFDQPGRPTVRYQINPLARKTA